jgi:hypothetical protein
MDAVKRERVIELGVEITEVRADIALLQAKLREKETELDQLFSDAPPSPNPATNGSATGAAATPAHRYSHPSLQAEAELSGVPGRVPLLPELIVPPVIGNLADQALAILKANPDRQLSGEIIMTCMNRMAGRTAPALLDSVNAALSRLTTDGLIVRVERGLYKAKPAMNTGLKSEPLGRASA